MDAPVVPDLLCQGDFDGVLYYSAQELSPVLNNLARAHCLTQGDGHIEACEFIETKMVADKSFTRATAVIHKQAD